MCEARAHRSRLECVEKQMGPVHYKSEVNTILTSPLEIATKKSIGCCCGNHWPEHFVVQRGLYNQIASNRKPCQLGIRTLLFGD